jgi:hypothetical protein
VKAVVAAGEVVVVEVAVEDVEAEVAVVAVAEEDEDVAVAKVAAIMVVMGAVVVARVTMARSLVMWTCQIPTAPSAARSMMSSLGMVTGLLSCS